MTRTITITDTGASLTAAAKEIAGLTEAHKVFALRGGMGAGKTTLINAVAAELGVTTDATCSPTFAIVNEYRAGETALPMYHLDLYRLETLEEAFDIGLEDYLCSGAVCMIEWPDRAEELLPDDTVEIAIDVDPVTDVRTLTVTTEP